MTSQDEASRCSRPAGRVRPSHPDARTVLMVTRRAPTEPGGVERVVTGLVTELARARPGWTVATVSAFREGSRLAGIDGLADVVASVRLGWRLRSRQADVVFVHCPECLWGIRLLQARRGGPPLVAVWHGAGPTPHLVLRGPGHPLARALARLRTAGERRALAAQGHVAVHRRLTADLRGLYGLDKPVAVVENAVDPTILERLARLPREQHRPGPVALWVGSGGHAKGLDVALAAVAAARRDLPGLRLVVVGVPAPRIAGPVEQVDWRGAVPPSRMAEVYRDADLLLFPTRYESFGLVVIEAMAAGLPVIVSNAVPAGIVADGRNGAVVVGHDPSRYAAALRRFADPQVRAAVGAANRTDARRFSARSAVAGYAAVVESFAGSR